MYFKISIYSEINHFPSQKYNGCENDDFFDQNMFQTIVVVVVDVVVVVVIDVVGVAVVVAAAENEKRLSKNILIFFPLFLISFVLVVFGKDENQIIFF